MGQRLSILIYHRVLSARDPLQPDIPTAAEFEARMRWLRRFFRVVPLSRGMRQLREGTLPARALSITFDDGYADNAEVALPILRKLGIPATFFIATGFLEGGRMWNDTVIELVRRAGGRELQSEGLNLPALACHTEEEQRSAIAQLLGALKYQRLEDRSALTDRFSHQVEETLPRLMMSESQVRELRDAGMEIGAHTVNHPILAGLDEAYARREIEESRTHLEEMLGQRVPLFAYPNGIPGKDYTNRDVELVRALGFDGAVSTAWGTALSHCDPCQMPRFTPWDQGTLRFLGRLACVRWFVPKNSAMAT